MKKQMGNGNHQRYRIQHTEDHGKERFVDEVWGANHYGSNNNISLFFFRFFYSPFSLICNLYVDRKSRTLTTKGNGKLHG